MKDKLVDKISRVTASLDQSGVGNISDKELSDSFAKAGNRIRSIVERIEKRSNALDEFANKFLLDNNRYPTIEEQDKEMERIGLKENGEWTNK